MRALTLWPEWAWCICWLGKRVENRTWLPAPGQLRVGDRFAIHAGRAGGGSGWRDRLHLAAHVATEALAWRGELDVVTTRWGTNLVRPDGQTLPNPAGAIVAVATYGGEAPPSDDPWYAPDQLQWLLLDVMVLPRPIHCRGAQGLWMLPGDVEREVLAQLGGTP